MKYILVLLTGFCIGYWVKRLKSHADLFSYFINEGRTASAASDKTNVILSGKYTKNILLKKKRLPKN